LQGCEPKGSPRIKVKKGSLGVKAKALQRCGPRGSRGVPSYTLENIRKCEGV